MFSITGFFPFIIIERQWASVQHLYFASARIVGIRLDEMKNIHNHNR